MFPLFSNFLFMDHKKWQKVLSFHLIVLFFFFPFIFLSILSTPDRFGSDKVINTVLNINDSNTAEVLNNFNISKDEILRRISTLPQPMVNNGNGRSSVSERSHIDNDANFKPSSESSGTEIEKQE